MAGILWKIGVKIDSSLIFYFVANEENPRSTKNASRNLESPAPATNYCVFFWKFRKTVRRNLFSLFFIWRIDIIFWSSRSQNEIPGKNLLKVVKCQNLVENVVMYGKYSLINLHYIIVLRAELHSAQKW